MDEEIDAIERNNTWELVNFPEGKNTIGVKQIYKTKVNAEGEIEKDKARLVAQGFSQQPNIDYNETFTLVARLDTAEGYQLWMHKINGKYIRWMLSLHF